MDNEFYKIISADAKTCTHKVQFKTAGTVAFESNGEIEVVADEVLTLGINEDWDFLPKK